MPMMTTQRQLYEQGAAPSNTITTITIGTVVDTNDPQEMGRLRICCTQWGDTLSSDVTSLPWAIYAAPFAGQTQVGTRGPGVQQSTGGIAYGVWAIPKVGALAVVMCVDGNPMSRIWLGCVYDQFVPHTMPHGRFMYDSHPALEGATASVPHGPYTSTENYIKPLADNIKTAFGTKSNNFEYQTRAADYSVSGISVDQLSHTYSSVPDDDKTKSGEWTSTQGYQTSRTDPNAPSKQDRNYDSLTYSVVTPGFHALSMDDRQENCRVRLRTSSGHQIILDDTNERIYLSTATGNNWIEMDQCGNVDVFSSARVSIRAASDVNITSDATVRLYGKKGVHIKSDGEIRMESKDDMHFKSAANIRSKADSSIFVDAGSELNLKSGSSIKLSAGGEISLQAGSEVAVDGSSIYLNSGRSSSASNANAQPSMWTNRVPTHEPYPRGVTKDDFSHAPEHSYDSTSVNRVERGITLTRGMYWRR